MLYSKIIGEGAPFIILHGFLGMGDNWKTLGKQISELGFEVHLVDQRNHGRSFHKATFNYDLLVNDLKHYIDQKNIDAPIILGHSMGGKTAMLFSTMYPTRVSKLIVADIAPRYYPVHHTDILSGLRAMVSSPEAMLSRKTADAFLSDYVHDMGTRMFLLKNLYWVKPNETLGLRINLEVLSENVEEVGQELPSGNSFKGPALFLKGDRSEYIQDADENDIVNAFAKAKVVVIANAGHWLHAENPAAFFEAVKSFVAEG